MKELLFNVKDNKLYINVPQQLTNKQFLEAMKERIEKLMIFKESLKYNVVLNIEERILNNREIVQLFDILNELDVFYIQKINCKNRAKESLSIYKNSLRGGQIRFFEKSVLVIGNINKGSKIIVHGDLYVFGTINGDIELKDKKSKIYCQSINNSLVKIGDIYKLYSEEVNDIEISCLGNEIIESDYIKGENNYGKSNSSYIG